MNIPSSPFTAQNGIVIQCRSTPPRQHRSSDSAYTIPPMTPVFATASPAMRANPVRGSDVKDVHAQWFASEYDGAVQPSRETFVGVSIEGIGDGSKCRKFGDAHSRFSCVTRGLVTIMCDYGDVESIPLGTNVKVIKGKNRFAGMPAALTPFSLAPVTGADPQGAAIGMLMGKPDMRNRSNEARVLLF